MPLQHKCLLYRQSSITPITSTLTVILPLLLFTLPLALLFYAPSRTPRHFTPNLTSQRYTSELQFPPPILCDPVHLFCKAFMVHGAWRGARLPFCVHIDSLPIILFRLIPNAHSLLVSAFLEIRI